MVEETLGTEFSQSKIYYLLFLLGLYLVYFFFYIGMMADVNAGIDYANQASKLWYYIWFGLVLGVLPFLMDMIFNQNKDLPLDTISYENNSPLPVFNNFWFQIGSSFFLAMIVFLRIRLLNQAFVKAPSFSLTIPVISQLGLDRKVIGALISGLTAGFVESMVFFGVIFPIIYAVLKQQELPDLFALIVSGFFAVTVFTGYHWFAYGYQITALLTVAFFGASQVVLAYLYKSMIPLFFTHFINNFAVVLFTMSAYVVQVVV